MPVRTLVNHARAAVDQFSAFQFVFCFCYTVMGIWLTATILHINLREARLLSVLGSPIIITGLMYTVRVSYQIKKWLQEIFYSLGIGAAYVIVFSSIAVPAVNWYIAIGTVLLIIWAQRDVMREINARYRRNMREIDDRYNMSRAIITQQKNAQGPGGTSLN